MQFIDLQAQYRELKSSIDRRIQDVLDRGSYIGGQEIQEFEEKLADYVGVNHVIGCANGTDALQLALMALDIGPGDAVFCANFSFFASAEVIALVGATPVFVDIEAATLNLCPQHLQYQLEQVREHSDLQPKAVIAVDLFGLPADYESIRAVAAGAGIKIIEDAAQGIGGEAPSGMAGSLGDIATTSFFPSKPLGCYGDGGAVLCNDDELAALVRSYGTHGKGRDKYDNVRIGMNSRLDTIQAAVLLEKFAVFSQELVYRRALARNYIDRLPVALGRPGIPPGFNSSWALFTVRHPDRDALQQHLSSLDIPSVVYYRKGLDQQAAFDDLEYKSGPFPQTDQACAEVLSLPMHPYLGEREQQRVIDAVAEYL